MEFIMTGDSLFSSRNLKATIDKKLVARLQGGDAVFTNAEFVTPRITTAPAAGRGYQTSVRPKTLDEFKELNIQYVSFANNHTGDYGVEGLLDTIEEAEIRGLQPLGVGRSLSEARKPQFIDTKDGRIAIITIDVTRSEVFAASNAGNGVPARAGVNPLRWSRKYVVDDGDFETLKKISQHIGIAESMREGKRIETFPENDNQIDFGSLFEGYLTFEKGQKPGVETAANPLDQKEILDAIKDAKNRSDFVFVNLHTHEGLNENWYADYPPTFIEEFSHEAIDAGANAVVGHGAHFTRGVELYKGSPIFYNIGSLLMEFEAGESIISPEMFTAYGYAENELPSTLHRNRVKDKEGNWQGFYSERKFSLNFALSFQLNRDEEIFSYELIPLDLQLTDSYVTKRGLPVIGDESVAKELVYRLNAISQNKYGTQVYLENSKIKIRSC